MNDQNIRTYDMFGRVSTFGRDNAGDFGEGSQSAANFAQLAAIALEIEQGHAGRKSRYGSLKKAKLEVLREEMKNLACTAREIEKQVPGAAEKFRMPALGSQAALLATGRKMATGLKAEGMLARFTALEVSPEIVNELEALLQEIDTANDESESTEVEGVENTAAINLAIAKGKNLVDGLNAAVRNKYKNQPAKIAAWETASHIERAPRRKKATEPAAPVAAG